MMDLEFVFEQNPWEAALDAVKPGEHISAVRFLALMEGEDEAALEDAFCALEDNHITLDISALPTAAAEGQAAVRLRQEQQLVQQGKLLQGLEENDPLRLYLQELAMIPAAGDISLLAEQYLSGSETAARSLADLSLARVIEISQQMTGRGVLLLDLIQEGSLGLWQGILRYTGGDFEVHRDWWIRQYMAKAVLMQARSSGIGQKLRQGMADYRDVDQRLLSELGRNPTLEEITQAMHITLEDGAVYQDMLRNARTAAQAKATQEPEEERPEDQQAVEDTAYFQMRQRISDLLSGLPERDAKLLSLRFGLEGGLPLSPEDTGKKLGLTPEEVVAAEAAALAKLRQEK